MHPMRRHSLAEWNPDPYWNGNSGPAVPAVPGSMAGPVPPGGGLMQTPDTPYQQGLGSMSLPPDIRMDYERMRVMQQHMMQQV